MAQNHPSNNANSILQTYNNEMIKCIEDLFSRREELKRQLHNDQEEKEKLHHDIKMLTGRLATLNEDIARKMSSQNEFDKAITETQAAYTRVMETSQILVQSVQGTALKLRTNEQVTSDREKFQKPAGMKRVQIKKEPMG